jgi:cytochrome c553
MTPKEGRGGRIMKVMSLRLVLQTAVLVVVFSAPGRADDRGTAGISKQGLQAKLEYCKTCHGLSGQGYRGYFPMPRLAGQQPTYIDNQLRAFIERRRTNPVMFNVAHVLSPSMVAALAEHFKGLNPNPIGGAPKEPLALGKTIYDEGLPEANVAACSACHGPEAKGKDEIPRLAGQLFPYAVKVLTNWDKERGLGSAKDTSAIMVPTTHNLTPSQIAAIAAYVSNLK